MFQKLRRRFILISTFVVFLVVAAIVIAMNLVSSWRMQDNIERTMTKLKEIVCISSIEGANLPGKDPMGNLWMETRYFTVAISYDGLDLRADVSHVAAVSENRAVEIALPLFRTNQSSGSYEGYRYDRLNMQKGCVYIFLDCTKDLSYGQAFLAITSWVGVGGILFFLVIIIIASGMLVKPVAETYRKQRQFITDAGHELKTPLAVIGANTEIIEMEKGADEWTEGIRAEVGRMKELTEKLVYLATLEEERQLNVTQFDFSETLSQTIRLFEGVVMTQGKTLRADVEEGIMLKGDESLITQLEYILLDNAAKYSDEGGKISVSLRTVGNKTVFSVSNPAKEVGEGDQKILFERFYRADGSRNSETGGHGIGLSVAQSIVSAHKGKITADCKGGILTFTVTL